MLYIITNPIWPRGITFQHIKTFSIPCKTNHKPKTKMHHAICCFSSSFNYSIKKTKKMGSEGAGKSGMFSFLIPCIHYLRKTCICSMYNLKLKLICTLEIHESRITIQLYASKKNQTKQIGKAAGCRRPTGERESGIRIRESGIRNQKLEISSLFVSSFTEI